MGEEVKGLNADEAAKSLDVDECDCCDFPCNCGDCSSCDNYSDEDEDGLEDASLGAEI